MSCGFCRPTFNVPGSSESGQAVQELKTQLQQAERRLEEEKGISDIAIREMERTEEERNAAIEAAEQAREVLRRLCDKLDAITKATEGVFVLASIHGANYKGPTYEQELKDARAVLTMLERALKGSE